MNLKTHILFILLILSVHSFFAQDMDSLKLALSRAKHDTTRCSTLSVLVENEIDDAVWPVYNEQLQKICEKNLENRKTVERAFYLKYLAIALNNKGFLAQQKDESSKALDYFLKSLEINKSINDKPGIANNLNSIGYIYNNHGDITRALEYYHNSLKIEESIGNEIGIGNALNSIGGIYKNLASYPKALEYYYKSLKFQEKINDKEGISYTYNNIGFVYIKQGNIPKAYEALSKALKIREELNDKKGIANSLINIGWIYKNEAEKTKDKQGRFTNDSMLNKAIDYFNRSLKVQEEIDARDGIVSALNNLSDIKQQQGKLAEAKEMAVRCLKISREIGYTENIKSASLLLSIIYVKTGDYKGAYEMQVLYKQMSDSVNNESNKKASVQKSFQYEYEKKSAADSVKTAEEKKVSQAKLAASEASLKQEKTQRFALYGGLVLVLVFAGFIFNRFKVTQKQKQIIEIKEQETQHQNEIITQQKHLVEEKHKEITDSINYAERIQRSFLASKQLLNENLKDYFVFFQPKDVVSGDFYWASKLSNDRFAMVIADSTGHGVPGAIMSILNISCLEKSVEEKQLSEPADILNHTRLKIIERLKKDGSEDGGKDGMDCSLISFDFKNENLTYASANNPVWVVRDGQIIELPSDKMPVGKHDKDQVSFKQHTVDIKKGDMIYAITDGMPDQFGGPKGKKFMYKQLKELVISIAHLSMAEQHKKLADALNGWKNDLEQVDDITVVGVRV